MAPLTRSLGISCLLLAMLLDGGKAEFGNAASFSRFTDTDETELMQQRVGVIEGTVVENLVVGTSHNETAASSVASSNDGQASDEGDRLGNLTDIPCAEFGTEPNCHAGGCTWSGDSCELDDANPDDVNIECSSFQTESHCSVSGCKWTGDSCVEDTDAGALLQDETDMQNEELASIDEEFANTNEEVAGRWCRRRWVHRRRWGGCRRRRRAPSAAKAPKDGYHQECWSNGLCKDDGKNFCAWCGQHNGELMYCCNKGNTYAKGHACHGAVFSSAAYHHCVTPGQASASPILAYKWLDLGSAKATQSSTSHGAAASRAIDGRASATWSHGSCTHTYTNTNPWWEVDLGTTQEIKAVTLTNRGDCCGSRLSPFSVRVGSQVCASGVSIKQGETKLVPCDAVGSTIRVFLAKKSIITICEFRAAVGVPNQGGALYTKAGDGVAGPGERWNVGGAKGKGVWACYQAVIADSKCNQDYFTYVDGGDKNCGCKTSSSPLSVRSCSFSDFYKLKAITTTTPAPVTTKNAVAPTLAPTQTTTLAPMTQVTDKSLFERIDLDGDGCIKTDELQKALDSGLITNLFDRLDLDRSGSINPGELSKALKSPKTAQASTTVAPATVASTTLAPTNTLPSQAQKEAIVRKHNDLRAAMGASDMTKMKWDGSLAAAAQQWAAGCPSGHSQNRGNSVGENIAWKWATHMQLTANTDFTPSVQSWYDEIQDAGSYKTGGTFNGFQPCTGVCGHYTQVVWAAANKIGCGVAYCPHSTGMAGYELVCQYGSSVPSGYGGNMGGSTLFTKGGSCSKCPTGFQTCSMNLCSSGA